jgi:hypothetical protein
MISEHTDRISQIFFPQSQTRQTEIERANGRFVHYTSASAAVSILSRKEFWMRDPACMNDYTEVEHGLRCLYSAYNGERRGANEDEIANFLRRVVIEQFELSPDEAKIATVARKLLSLR